MSGRTLRFATIVVGALADLGVSHAVVAPGSRNTPLSMALAAEPRIDDLSIHDERSGGFMAIGLARSSRRPVIITCTSGTAAAEFHPAVVEASLTRVPLIVLTADRPHELHDVGAPQTIDQVHLFGRAVRWSHDLEAPSDAVSDRALSALAARLFAEAADHAGPVHLNMRFAEPLVPDGPAPSRPPTPRLVPGGAPVSTEAVRAIDEAVRGHRAVVVAGPSDDPELHGAAMSFSATRSVPILADPLSGLRRPGEGTTLAGGDLLAAGGFLDMAPPEVVIRIGAIPTSKPLWSWLEAHRDVEQILVDTVGWRDPLASISTMIRAEPAALLAAAADGGRANDGYASLWSDADMTARRAAYAVIDSAPFPNEPAIAATVDSSIPDGSTLWAASSMPVRNLDTFGSTRTGAARAFGNRGANGIDGLISAATGSALVSATPTYALAGDLSTFHDMNAIASAGRLGANLTVVVVNNDGGGIFHFLPQVEFPEVFERHFGTPHGLDFESIAVSLGARAATLTDRIELTSMLSEHPSGITVLQLRTDRAANRELHREVRRAVHQALAK